MQLVKRDYKLTAIEMHFNPFKTCHKLLFEYSCTLCVTLMKYNYQISERQLPNHHNNRKLSYQIIATIYCTKYQGKYTS